MATTHQPGGLTKALEEKETLPLTPSPNPLPLTPNVVDGTPAEFHQQHYPYQEHARGGHYITQFEDPRDEPTAPGWRESKQAARRTATYIERLDDKISDLERKISILERQQDLNARQMQTLLDMFGERLSKKRR